MDKEVGETPDCACILQESNSGTYRNCYEEGNKPDGTPKCPIYPCIPPCKNCENDTECTECLDEYNRKSKPDCNCLDGYELDLNN